MSGRVFQDVFELLFDEWLANRPDLLLANVDSLVKGVDYVVCTRNPIEYKAAIQCRFSLSAGGSALNSHLKLKRDLDEARKELGPIPLAAAIFRAANLPDSWRIDVGADRLVVFLNHGGVTGLKLRTQELKDFVSWLQAL